MSLCQIPFFFTEFLVTASWFLFLTWRMLLLTHVAVLWSSQVVAATLLLGRPQPQLFPCKGVAMARNIGSFTVEQVITMLVMVFFTTAVLSSIFLSLTIAFACAASLPPSTMAFTLLAIGAEAPDCIVNFIASK